jgi:hypothetical protein
MKNKALAEACQQDNPQAVLQAKGSVWDKIVLCANTGATQSIQALLKTLPENAKANLGGLMEVVLIQCSTTKEETVQEMMKSILKAIQPSKEAVQKAVIFHFNPEVEETRPILERAGADPWCWKTKDLRDQLEEGTKPNIKTLPKNHPLVDWLIIQAAALVPETCQEILETKNPCTEAKNQALVQAMLQGNTKTVEILRKAGAATPLLAEIKTQEACLNNEITIAEMEIGLTACPEKTAHQILWRTIGLLPSKAIKWLISQGASHNVQDGSITLLERAATRGNLEATRLLAEAGMVPCEDSGFLSVVRAAAKGHTECAEILASVIEVLPPPTTRKDMITWWANLTAPETKTWLLNPKDKPFPKPNPQKKG